MRSALLIGVVLLAGTPSTQAGLPVYVDVNATGPVHDGTSWCLAFLDLQQALAVAVVGTEVRVAQGVYQPAPAGGSRDAAFALPSGATVLGSYQGCNTPDPDARDFPLYATVLSGDLSGDDGPDFTNRLDNVYHVVTTHNVSTSTVLDGFTIRGGHADGPNAGPSVDSRDQGAGVNNYFGQPTVSNCTILDNFTANHGAFNDHGGATLIDCTVRDNWSGELAAGLYMHFDVATIVSGCQFISNTTAGRGGGAYLKGDSAPPFSDCFFSGNSALLGGGMYCDSNNAPSLTNCTFSDNTAGPGPGRGGGLYALNSDAVLVGCTFLRNEVTDDNESGGGAIYTEGGTLQLDQCDFFSNRAPGPATNIAGAGGIYHNGTTSTISQCLFDGNTALYYGAAMRNVSSNVTVEDCVFNKNVAYWGAVLNKSGVANFSRCRFTGNSGNWGGAINAQGSGGINVSDSVFLNNVATAQNAGAVRLGPSTTDVITNVLFAGNVANRSGGAMESSARQLSLINCVFSANSAGSLGGALLLQGPLNGAQTVVSNCTFFGHSADAGQAIALFSNTATFEHDLIVENSILFNGGGEIWDDGSPDLSMTIAYSDIEGDWPGVGNLASYPRFLDPDGADNLPGTEDDNLRLLNTSPCANVGNNATVVSATDADGLPRIAFGVVDMGAYELQEPAVPPPAMDVPTVSEWGLAIMASLIAALGTIMLRRRRAVGLAVARLQRV